MLTASRIAICIALCLTHATSVAATVEPLRSGGLSRAPTLEQQPDSPPGDSAFALFVNHAAACADTPAGGLLYRSPAMEVQLGTTKVEAKWLSSRRPSPDDVTLCLTLDRPRLHLLLEHCRWWGGPMSVAVYQPLPYFQQEENAGVIADFTAELFQLHGGVEQARPCTLDVVFISELRHPSEVWAFPDSLLRNQAIARSRTKLILLLEADFLPSAGLRQAILKPDVWPSVLQGAYTLRHAFVLPAFDTSQDLAPVEGADMAWKVAGGTKADLQAAFDAGNVTTMRTSDARSQTATDYPRWFASRGGYVIQPHLGYEPFVMLSRAHVPWFDERFRGNGQDRTTHTALMAAAGITFVAHPSAWVVRKPAQGALTAQQQQQQQQQQRSLPTHAPALPPADKMVRGMLAALRAERYPRFGVTTLAGCRPVKLLQEEGAWHPRRRSDDAAQRKLAAQQRQRQAGSVRTGFVKAAEEGWWST